MDLFKKTSKKKDTGKPAVILIKVIAFLIIAGLLVWTASGINGYLKNWSYFNVDKIIITGTGLSSQEAARYCGLSLPLNILTVDLEQLSYQIKALHPELNDVIVRKTLPDTLSIQLIRRQPVAVVNYTDASYKVDAGGFVMQVYDSDNIRGLPEIIGIRHKELARRLLGVSDDGRLHRALDVIRRTKETGLFKDYGLVAVDVRDSRNCTIWINNNVRIILSQENLEDNLFLLGRELPSIDLNEITYIDMRFDDIILGTK